jgi:hypothetical protein
VLFSLYAVLGTWRLVPAPPIALQPHTAYLRTPPSPSLLLAKLTDPTGSFPLHVCAEPAENPSAEPAEPVAPAEEVWAAVGVAYLGTGRLRSG